MKKKGRYVVEAAYLVPGICILLVYIVFFTLYAHDHAVCVHTVLETAIRGSYPDGRTSGQIRDDMERELAQKLSERLSLLWAFMAAASGIIAAIIGFAIMRSISAFTAPQYTLPGICLKCRCSSSLSESV